MPARKRKAPETPTVSGSRRRSQRLSSSSKKSRYFEDDSDNDSSDDSVSKEETETVARRKNATNSGRKSRGRKPKESDEEEDVYEDDQEQAAADQQEEVEDDEGEFDEDAPPKVTFIPLPKLRNDGGIGYEDDRAHPNTLLFLKDLKANNKRSWLKFHDQEYRRALKDWQSYVETMTEKIIEVDDSIPELPFKDVNFRIYRDIRFSSDPTPYKPHFSAAWSRTGRKGPYACYYVHMEPGKCFVGGGLWHPDGGALHKLRASIDERPRRWRRVLADGAFRRTFLPAARDADEESAVKAFAGANAENALKTKPKGFVAEHRDIELLKLRNFTVGKKIPDTHLTSADGQAKIAEVIGAMVGFQVTHLNNIVMPDPGQDDSESESDNE
ncbi:hypothetical protein QBC33DRAFT_490911 [Phialemonium atrogriseum]|uniref:DUF2461 domain-containing protein n=1 Tax=Phialemonium atrogriseum TaxID=1093897 RepID=A0AAJ0FNZ8_9PEZI|nr:uncharacterized protein QBC33DRAFT_490911 [Phialemonium atrogriseum]KAK1767670.1 hypothetical protein QBC33DRAFT_490911 [Phialemonium atrogriseum]